MRHQRYQHTRQGLDKRVKTKLAQPLVDARVLVKELSIAGLDQEFIDAEIIKMRTVEGRWKYLLIRLAHGPHITTIKASGVHIERQVVLWIVVKLHLDCIALGLNN